MWYDIECEYTSTKKLLKNMNNNDFKVYLKEYNFEELFNPFTPSHVSAMMKMNLFLQTEIQGPVSI